jgi:hypothetical protein
MSRELFAWVAQDLEGFEGIVMIPDANGNPLPLVAVNLRVARFGRRDAVKVGNARNETVRLVRYVEAEVIDTIEP